jgi:hypothetical protein
MNDFNITSRLDACHDNRFDELLSNFDCIMLSIMENEVPQYHFKAELIHWCYHVDTKLDKLRRDREAFKQVAADNLLIKSNEVFGTEA